METARSPKPPAARADLETFLVEWKLDLLEVFRDAPELLETFLVEWKHVSVGDQRLTRHTLKPS